MLRGSCLRVIYCAQSAPQHRACVKPPSLSTPLFLPWVGVRKRLGHNRLVGGGRILKKTYIGPIQAVKGRNLSRWLLQTQAPSTACRAP